MTPEPLMPWWTASAESDKVVPAFVKALHTIEDIVRDKPVRAGAMKYNYADLATVLDEIRPKLKEQGLALSQVPTIDGVMTTLYHESGQWIAFAPLEVTPVGSGPQQQGSAITYGRRYSIMSICGMATEDDDGRSASVHTAPPAHDPAAERVDRVLRDLSELSEDDKTKVKEWADGKSLSGKTLYADHDWLSEVEAFLDEGLGLEDKERDDDTPID